MDSKYQDAECFDRVMIVADEERLAQIEAENAALRAELDCVWKFLHQIFEGRFNSSEN